MLTSFETKLLALVFIVAGGMAAQTKQPQPSLRETLEWMQNTPGESGNEYIAGEVRSVRLTDFSECWVHFTYTTTKGGVETYGLDEYLNLADIDPGYVMFYPHQLPLADCRSKSDLPTFWA